MAKKKGNNYVIDNENQIAKIELCRRNVENLWVTIDLDDLEKVLNIPYTWFAKYDNDIQNYYAVASWYCPETQKSKPVYLHQFITDAQGKIVDHINHDTLDNRKENLRVIADSNNSKNRKTKNSNNKSGYRNVCWNKTENIWMVQLSINGKNTYLKSFPYEQLEEAGQYAEEMRQKYYGEYAGNA